VLVRRVLTAAAAAALILLPACAPRRPEPAPPPPPEPAAPPPQPAPPPLAWQDAPASPGDWRLGEEGGAVFGAGAAPALIVRCEANRQLALVRAGATGTSLIVRTSYGERRLPASAGQGGLAARLPAGDPLLDEIAFSRGRFAIEADGAPLLIVPAWPEPARVVEDCRG